MNRRDALKLAALACVDYVVIFEEDTPYELIKAVRPKVLVKGGDWSVDKIVGPGNLFVTLAKQQVFGLVGIDGLAGPTETVVIADETANPAWVAADLLAQAEHDPLATAILLTPSRPLAEALTAHAAAAERRAEAS